jgi:thioredoxin reductase
VSAASHPDVVVGGGVAGLAAAVIDETERTEREARSLEGLSERFSDPHPDDQITHPTLEKE